MIAEPTEGLSEFSAVVEAGSISAAARQLGVPRATLSRRLAALEASLGVRLLHRSTRRVVPSPAGEELHRRARRILEDAREARDAVRRLDGVPRGRLRISALPRLSPDSLSPSLRGPLSNLVLSYMQRYPETEVELSVSLRQVDLIAEGFDVALRAGLGSSPGLVARKLGGSCVFPVASPAYLERAGTPRSPAELSDHVCFTGFERGEVPRRQWPLRAGGSVPVSGRLASNDLSVLRWAALDGLGIVLLPTALCYEDLETGRLVPVLADSVGVDNHLAVVYASREFLEPKIRAFVDMAVELLAPMLAQIGLQR